LVASSGKTWHELNGGCTNVAAQHAKLYLIGNVETRANSGVAESVGRR
jgi:hypothetical protein